MSIPTLTLWPQVLKHLGTNPAKDDNMNDHGNCETTLHACLIMMYVIDFSYFAVFKFIITWFKLEKTLLSCTAAPNDDVVTKKVLMIKIFTHLCIIWYHNGIINNSDVSQMWHLWIYSTCLQYVTFTS